MTKKNVSMIVAVLLALLLIAFVIWMFDKKIEGIEKKISSLLILEFNFSIN